MAFLKEYKINKAGKANDLNIPTGFRIGINHIIIKKDEDDTKFKIVIIANTYKNDKYSKELNNDEVSKKYEYTINDKDLPATIKTFINNKIKPELETAYDVSNVEEL